MERNPLRRTRGGVCRHAIPRCHRPRSQWLFIAVAFVLCLSSAATVVAHPHPHPDHHVTAESDATGAVAVEVEAPIPVEETLLIDTRPAPPSEGRLAAMEQEDHELKVRNPQGSSAKSGSTATSRASPLPGLLEDNLSGNFTRPNPQSSETPCGSFLATLVANQTFQQCYPFSVLLLVCSPWITPSNERFCSHSNSPFPCCKYRARNPSSRRKNPLSASPTCSTSRAGPTSSSARRTWQAWPPS